MPVCAEVGAQRSSGAERKASSSFRVVPKASPHAFFSSHSLWGIAPKQTNVPSSLTAQVWRQTANATATTGVESRAMLKWTKRCSLAILQ